jgi:hypothetical protein
MPGLEDDELCIRAMATDVTTDAAATAIVQEVVMHSGVGGMIESASHDPIFEFDRRQVDAAPWLNVGQPSTRAVRYQWRAT